MTTLRITFIALLTAPLIAFAQSYPAKPIRVVVPFPPGGAFDTLVRPVAQKLTETIGQPVIVDNRPGAFAIIGADIVAKAAPDGYTILTNSNSYPATQFFVKKMPHDALKDFTPITAAVSISLALAVHPSLQLASVTELLEYEKKNPGKLFYGTAGVGTTQHLGGLLLTQLTSVKLVHAPYKGGGPALNDLLGGQIPMAFLTLSTLLPNVRSGKIRLLGVLEAKRSRLAPDVPTLGESGIPGYAIPETQFGFFGPAGLPRAIVMQLNAEFLKALHAPEVRARLESSDFDVIGSSPEEFAATIRKDTEVFRRIVNAAGIQPE